MKPYETRPLEDNSEGELDGESDASDDDYVPEEEETEADVPEEMKIDWGICFRNFSSSKDYWEEIWDTTSRVDVMNGRISHFREYDQQYNNGHVHRPINLDSTLQSVL